MLLTGCQKTDDVLVGPNWEALRKLKADTQAFQVEASGKENLRVGDELRYLVTSSHTGKLWMLQVDAQDQVSVLYPNEYVADNTIEANLPATIPPAGATWTLEASEPLGKNLLAFIVLSDAVNLSDAIDQEKDFSKALRIVENSTTWGMTTKVIEVQEAKP
jgi:hypothetical protein